MNDNQYKDDKQIFKDVPVGFGLSLCQNVKAMNNFVSLDDTSKQRVISKAKKINSKTEMQNIVSNLGQNNMNFFD